MLVVFFLSALSLLPGPSPDQEQICSEVLNLDISVPISAMMEEKTNKWSADIVNEKSGYWINKDGLPGVDGDTEIGKKSVRILIDYGIIDSPQIYCGFDDNSNLIDLAVFEEMNN